MKDEVKVEETTLAVPPAEMRRASWGAIFAGVFFTTILQAMFTLLGMAVGFGPLRHSQESAGQSVAIGAGIWLLVTGLVSIWIGSCVAGRLAGGPRRADGMLHGLITWSVSVAVAFGLLATTIGTVVGGTAALVNGALTAGESNQEQNAIAGLGQDIRSAFSRSGALLPPTGRTDGQSVPGNLTSMALQDPELGGALTKLEAQGGASQSPADRDQVVNLLTTKHNLSRQDADNLLNQWDQQFEQARGQATEQANQAAPQIAHRLSQGALWGFLALFLGLLVSAWGGWAGAASLPKPVEPVAPAPVPVR